MNARIARAQAAAGTISALNGTVTITRGGRTFPATYNAPLQVGDNVVTGADGRATLTLTDGSQLELTESSSMVISSNLLNANGTRNSTSLSLLGGIVRSFVRVTAGTPPNYEVRTPNAVASARGTTYDVDFDHKPRKDYPGCNDFTYVLDWQGSVDVASVSNPSSPVVHLQPGQKTFVPCGGYVQPATSITGATAAGGAAAAGGGLGDFGAIMLPTLGLTGLTGAIIGGYAGAGGFSSSTSTPTPQPTATSLPSSPER